MIVRRARNDRGRAAVQFGKPLYQPLQLRRYRRGIVREGIVKLLTDLLADGPAILRV
jgi:hypothetical protein